jgi:hypothetical protein
LRSVHDRYLSLIVVVQIKASLLPWQRALDKLVNAVAPRLMKIFKVSNVAFAFHVFGAHFLRAYLLQSGGRRRGEIDQNGRIQRSQGYPTCKRRVPQPLQDGEVLILGLLALWRVYPGFYQTDSSNQPGTEWVEGTIRLWESSIDMSVKAALIANLVLSVNAVLQTPSASQLQAMGEPGLSELLTGFLRHTM